MSETLTATIRRRANEAVGRCPTCGQRQVGVPAIAEAIGIPYVTLWRFLGGKDISGRNLDKVNAWLEQRS